MESRIVTLQHTMKDREDEWDKSEKYLQEQLRDLKEKLNAAQRVKIIIPFFNVLYSCTLFAHYHYA